MNPDTDLVSSDASTQTDVHDDDLDIFMAVLDDSAIIIDDSQHPDDTSSENVKYSDDLTVSTHRSDWLPLPLRKSLDIHTPAPIYKPILMSPPTTLTLMGRSLVIYAKLNFRAFSMSLRLLFVVTSKILRIAILPGNEFSCENVIPVDGIKIYMWTEYAREPSLEEIY